MVKQYPAFLEMVHRLVELEDNLSTRTRAVLHFPYIVKALGVAFETVVQFLYVILDNVSTRTSRIFQTCFPDALLSEDRTGTKVLLLFWDVLVAL